ncbi:hypothetical protein [Neisseria musculi]|uniref:hypothetical protein n=1 Tax=Neisseria musculi TaxID=1815583 RepID=UPI001FE2F84B|nr:hypothetical protein [Neisseria musculi]
MPQRQKRPQQQPKPPQSLKRPKGRLKAHSFNEVKTAPLSDGLKTKDLIGIPWRVALALQADGWYLRQDIIWHKTNPCPNP